ncbi:MAG: hypothetical protein IKS98_13170 [Lachnospiraceae bacterium]|nr:hypothetical protein [Lachnospiraceae bacterium]
MTKLNYSRRLGWEKKETKSAGWYIAYVIFMITVMYLSKACVFDAPGKAICGTVFLGVFAMLEDELEKYYGGFSGLIRVPLVSVKVAGIVFAVGIFICSTVKIMFG